MGTVITFGTSPKKDYCKTVRLRNKDQLVKSFRVLPHMKYTFPQATIRKLLQ